MAQDEGGEDLPPDGEDLPPDPQGHFAGIPYDWRRPTRARVKSRMWNRNDARLLTPRAFGWGYDLNLYWLAHPGDYVKSRRRE